MQANITDNQWVYLDQVSQGAEEALVSWFSVRDPKAFHSNSEWDGWTRKYNTVKQRLQLPYLSSLIECCRVHRIPLTVNDARPAPVYPAPQEEQITKSFLPNVTLEDYQVRAMQSCCKHEIGIIKAVTGAGKTEIMCGIVKMFRCPTVIITEQIVVLEQIVERLMLRQVVHRNDIGMFCCGHLPEGNLVIVGSIQSLTTPTKPDRARIKVNKKSACKMVRNWIEKNTMSDEGTPMLERVFPKSLADALYANPNGVDKIKGIYYKLLAEFCMEIEFERQMKAYETRLAKALEIQEQLRVAELLLVDECDLASNDMYGMMFRKYYNGRRKYGFSGTPFDKKKPVENLKLKGFLGDIISETRREEVQAAGRIIPVKFHMFGIGPIARADARAYDVAVKEEMVENTTFHNTVARIVASFPNDGTLVLVDTSPIEPLGKALEKLIPNSKFISGSTEKKTRRIIIDQFESRTLTCLIGSKILKRGLDLKGGVENLVIIGGGQQWSDFDQKVGRAVRLNKRGWARVFAFFFLNNKYLYRHSKESLKALIDMGYPAKVHIDGVEIDGQKFIQSNFNIPRRR
jgi:superfamily II DNA or RNA helicase